MRETLGSQQHMCQSGDAVVAAMAINEVRTGAERKETRGTGWTTNKNMVGL